MDEEYSSEQSPEINSKLDNVAYRLVGFILSSTEQGNSVLGRAKLQKAIKQYASNENVVRCPMSDVLLKVNQILDDTYGFELIGVSTNKTTSQADQSGRSTPIAIADSTKSIKSSDINYFVLRNKLKPITAVENFKIELAKEAYETFLSKELGENEDYNSDGENIIPQSQINATLSSDYEIKDSLVLKGILSVMLCIILFSKNNLLERDLYEELKNFGISENNPIPLLDMSIDSVLRIFVNQQYIDKRDQNTETGNVITTYHIGRRTKYEFDFDSVVLLVKEIMDIDVTKEERLKRDVKRALADSYS